MLNTEQWALSEWQNDETKRQIDQSVPAPVSGEQFFDKN